ncbi:hypothetical protein NNO04_14855 [Citrobacter sp. Awk 4]|uniref:anti-sigma factor family protein n=1 Tax=Citrobacter sp. Awk 4 TaxID=2963955 RepID=UPI0023036455|nr:hypothetical protein [Citrobacter sp. Awk 4]MDA8479977.1 hypothetical protein [Citrobacter sp. Awk 4]
MKHPPYNDETIVAWLDGEMSQDAARKFEAQLRSDEQLSERTAELMKSNQDFKRAFAPLLDEAPLARMQDNLERHLDKTQAPASGISRRALVAASVSFLVMGAGVGYLVRPLNSEQSENEHIRDLEAQYMALYSAETLLDMDSSAPVLQRGIARVAQDIGLQLREQQLELHGAELKMVRMLRYDAMPIAQIAWVHVDYGPMALCISPQEDGNSTEITREKRHSMNIAWWSRKGYQFVLIGRNPESQLQKSARQLYAALSQ